MEIGIVRQVDIDDEMQQSYLDYAMSVIVARALPDARDGLKPVHRRILHAMHAMGIGPDSDYKKSARIVGEVLGKFHPHGDMAVYDAMARMAQDFSMRYPLVEGQGNFGSIDGDPPAAMRYTEARMNPIAMEMMADIEMETVHFDDNFDGSLKEPVVLPSGLPNLLINGATGIAVGMATSTPPHNLGEVCDALIFMIENWSRMDSISLDDVMKYIKGPDFPTGGIILQEDSKGEGLTAAYATGRGKITLQAKVHVEEMSRGRARIIITELPYQINKSNLIERIADMTRSGGLEGLSDLRDESDRQGMRIVLELSKTADPDKVLAELYRRTPIQTTFSVIMLALVEGEPRLLNLKQALRVFLEHRLEVTQKRVRYQLAKARDREHILAGLKIALQNLDQVIQMIRTATDVDQARERLKRRLKLTPRQADAILNMPLRRLSSLERKKINQEHREVSAQIKALETLLRSKKKLLLEIGKELGAIKTTYGDRRRTQIAKPIRGKRARTVLTARDLTPEKPSWVVVDHAGMIYRTPSNRLPRLSGRAAPRLVVGASTRDTLYLFDTQGNAIATAVHTIPEGDQATDGVPVASKTPFPPEAEVIAGIALPPQQTGRQAEDRYLVFGTLGGMVKKSSLKELPGPSAKSFQVLKINKADALGWVRLTHGTDDLCLVTSHGMAIRFPESDVRPMGLVAAGVLGIRMEKKARVVALEIVHPQADLLLISEDGRGKRSSLRQFPRQGRYGKGVLAWKSSEGIKLIGAAVGRASDRAVAHLAKGAARSIRYSDVPRRTRAAGGKSLFELKAGNKVTHLASAQPRPVFEPLKSDQKKPGTPRPRKPSSKTPRKTAGRRRKTSSTTRRPTKRKTSK